MRLAIFTLLHPMFKAILEFKILTFGCQHLLIVLQAEDRACVSCEHPLMLLQCLEKKYYEILPINLFTGYLL